MLHSRIPDRRGIERESADEPSLGYHGVSRDGKPHPNAQKTMASGVRLTSRECLGIDEGPGPAERPEAFRRHQPLTEPAVRPAT